jgi:hypothetical protein
MLESEELPVFQKHEAAALFRALNRLREAALARAQALYPEATFQLPNLLCRDVYLSIAIDSARAPRRDKASGAFGRLSRSCFVFAWASRGFFL